MSTLGTVKYLWTASSASFIALAILAGCSKKTDKASDAAPVPAVATAPAPEAQPADPAAQPPSGPVLDTSQMAGDAKKAMADADAALRQREYEKAVKTMLAIQQAQLNEQQAAAARQQMIALQRNLANAAANGDPSAIAAAEMLRAAHRH
jgi:hypothetical protein